MKRTRGVLLLSFALAWAVLVAGPQRAHAQNPCTNLNSNTDYQELVAAGVKELKAAAYGPAFELFTSAQLVCPYDAGVTYYMARTKHLAGECAMAVLLYDQTVAHLSAGMVPSQLPLETVTARRDEAQSCADTAHMGTASFVCADDGVTLVLPNGSEVPCPYEGHLDSGSHQVTARLSGYASRVVTFDVAAGGRAEVPVVSFAPPTGQVVLECTSPREHLELVGKGDPIATRCPSQVEVPVGVYEVRGPWEGEAIQVTVRAGETSRLTVDMPATTDTPADTIQPPPIPVPVSDNATGMLGWALFGTGVALVGGGAAMQFVATQKVDDIEPAMTQVDAQHTQDDAELLSTVGMVGLGVGGATLATGLILVLLDDGADASDANAVSAAPWIASDGAGLAVCGRF